MHMHRYKAQPPHAIHLGKARMLSAKACGADVISHQVTAANPTLDDATNGLHNNAPKTMHVRKPATTPGGVT